MSNDTAILTAIIKKAKDKIVSGMNHHSISFSLLMYLISERNNKTDKLNLWQNQGGASHIASENRLFREVKILCQAGVGLSNDGCGESDHV